MTNEDEEMTSEDDEMAQSGGGTQLDEGNTQDDTHFEERLLEVTRAVGPGPSALGWPSAGPPLTPRATLERHLASQVVSLAALQTLDYWPCASCGDFFNQADAPSCANCDQPRIQNLQGACSAAAMPTVPLPAGTEETNAAASNDPAATAAEAVQAAGAAAGEEHMNDCHSESILDAMDAATIDDSPSEKDEPARYGSQQESSSYGIGGQVNSLFDSVGDYGGLQLSTEPQSAEGSGQVESMDEEDESSMPSQVYSMGLSLLPPLVPSRPADAQPPSSHPEPLPATDAEPSDENIARLMQFLVNSGRRIDAASARELLRQARGDPVDAVCLFNKHAARQGQPSSSAAAAGAPAIQQGEAPAISIGALCLVQPPSPPHPSGACQMGAGVGGPGLIGASPSGAGTLPHTGSSRSPGPSTGCDTGSSSTHAGPQRMPMPQGAVLTHGTFQPRALFLPSNESSAPTAPKRKLPFPVQPEAPSAVRKKEYSCSQCGQLNSHYAPRCPNQEFRWKPPAPPSLQPAAAPPHQHPIVPPAAAATAAAALSASAQPQAGSAVAPIDVDAD